MTAEENSLVFRLDHLIVENHAFYIFLRLFVPLASLANFLYR